MRKFLVLVFALSLFITGCEDPMPSKAITPAEYTINVVGTDEFKTEIEKALLWMKDNAEPYFKEVDSYIATIELDEKEDVHGGYTNPSLAQVFIARWVIEEIKHPTGTQLYPEYMLPGILVHEVAHIKQYRNRELYSGEAGERGALAYEREFYRYIGVNEVDIEAMAGDHLLSTRYWEQ